FKEADKAIEALSIVPDSEYKEALIALAYMAVKRTA
ncbi:octaprenyl diphosphate synthase, partial [Vibrio alfacsensis]